MDLVRLAYYPFLPEVRDAIQELGPDMAELLTSPRYEGARRRGRDRVVAAFDRVPVPPVAILDDRSAIQELSSIPIARMLVVLLGDRHLVRRYASSEAQRLEATLKGDPTALDDIAAGLEVPLQGDRIHFADYLKIAPLHMAEWKLIQRPVEKGWVLLEPGDAVGLCREALDARISTQLEAELGKPQPGDLRTALASLLEELEPLLEAAKEHWNTGDFGPVQKGLFPPCIKELFQDMAAGKMIPHHGRFAMASFLATIGMTSTDILDYFKEIPNFDPEKSRYQIEHIAGERGVDKYTPPGCATMQTHGICPLDKRDGLCAKIKHPLNYYRAKIRFAKQDEAEAAEKKPAADPESRPKGGGAA